VLFLELSKSRAELAFRLDVHRERSDAEGMKGCESRLAAVQGQLSELSERISRAGVTVAVPCEREIARLNESLAGHSAGGIAEAMKKRDGELYRILAQRGELLKRNFESREDIAKLSILLSRLQKDVRDAVAEAVRSGRLGQPIPIVKGEEALGRKVALILGRLGMPAQVEGGSLVPAEGYGEVAVQVHHRRVWVTPEVHEKLSLNLSKLRDIAPRIQLSNAVRQIKKFDEKEEKEFAAVQNEYLRLLKEQDDLLREFRDEENLSTG